MRAIRILGGRKKSAPTIAEQKVLGRTLCWVEQDTYYGRVGVMTCATHRLFFDDGSAEEAILVGGFTGVSRSLTKRR